MKFSALKTAISGALLMTSSIGMAAGTSDLQTQLDVLKAENQTIMNRLNATMDLIESNAQNENTGVHGSSGKTTVGGYGELHYANTDSGKEIDMHRFVLYLAHEFNDEVSFFSEMEVEHAQVEGNKGEVAIEQAYLEFTLNNNSAIRAGIILVPVGIMNETHEPPTFYGVERNNVETNILPTTWSEGGISLTGRLSDSLSYDVAVHSGLQIPAANNYAVRKGRQSVAQAPANNFAVTARMKWTGIAGLEIGGAIQQQSDATQGTDAAAGGATLIEAHSIYQHQQFALRALYASWNLDGSGPKAVGADKQSGWYVEPSYKLNPQWGVFVRQSSWDNQAGNIANTENTQTDAGFNYWPHENVVIKANIQQLDKAGTNDNGFMLGLGYQF